MSSLQIALKTQIAEWGDPPPTPLYCCQSSKVRRVALIAFTVLAVIATLSAVFFITAPLVAVSLFYISTIVASFSTIAAIVLAYLKPHPNSPEQRQLPWKEAEIEITAWLKRKVVTPEATKSQFLTLLEKHSIVSYDKWNEILAPYAKKFSYEQFVKKFSFSALNLLNEENQKHLRPIAIEHCVKRAVEHSTSELADIWENFPYSDEVLCPRMTHQEFIEALVRLRIKQIKNKESRLLSREQDSELFKAYNQPSHRIFCDRLPETDRQIVRSFAGS